MHSTLDVFAFWVERIVEIKGNRRTRDLGQTPRSLQGCNHMADLLGSFLGRLVNLALETPRSFVGMLDLLEVIEESQFSSAVAALLCLEPGLVFLCPGIDAFGPSL